MTSILVVCRGPYPSDFLVSTDRGANWTPMAAPQTDCGTSIMGSGESDIWTNGGGQTGGVWRNVSKFDGVSWASEDPGLMTDTNSVIAVLPNGTVLCGDYLGQLYQRSPGGVWSLAYNTGVQSVWRTNAVVISNALAYIGSYEQWTSQVRINRWAFGLWISLQLTPPGDMGFSLAGYGSRLWMTTWNNGDNTSRIWNLLPAPSERFSSSPAVFDPTIFSGESPMGGWAASETEVWFPARAGNVAVTTNGSNWTIQNVGTSEDLRWIWGFSATEVFVCGASGGIYKWNGTGWSQIHSSPGKVLLAMWGAEAAPPAPSLTDIDDVFVVAEDVIKIKFTHDLAVDQYYMDVSNYQITPAAGVTVLQVIRPVERNVTEVVLIVQGIREGQEYRIDLAAGTLRGIDGSLITDLNHTWTHRKTKTDRAVDSFDKSYGMHTRGTLRGVVEAITISDEEIGGDY